MSDYLIWSNQHGAWWRPNERGYTNSLDEAGRYDRATAQRIVDRATCDGMLLRTRTNPITGEGYEQLDEVLVRAPECIDDMPIGEVDGVREELARQAATVEDLTATLAMRTSQLRDAQQQLDAIGCMHTVHHDGIRLRVITRALHDRLCKTRVGTPQGTTPEVLGCARCGFCYPHVPATNDEPTGGNRG